MSLLPYAAILLAALTNAAGSALLKYSSVYRAQVGERNAIYILLFLSALAAFVGTFPFYAYGLSRLHLSVAQPVFSIGTYAATALVAVFAFHEPYSLMKIAGLLVVVVGVLMIANG